MFNEIIMRWQNNAIKWADFACENSNQLGKRFRRRTGELTEILKEKSLSDPELKMHWCIGTKILWLDLGFSLGLDLELVPVFAEYYLAIQ